MFVGITDDHIISILSGHQVENNIFLGLVVIFVQEGGHILIVLTTHIMIHHMHNLILINLSTWYALNIAGILLYKQQRQSDGIS